MVQVLSEVQIQFIISLLKLIQSDKSLLGFVEVKFNEYVPNSAGVQMFLNECQIIIDVLESNINPA